MSAVANFHGGEIIFGIDDEKTIGVRDPDEVCLDVENMINDSLKPKPYFSLNIDRKASVKTLTINEGLFKPYLYPGKAFKRSETSAVEVDQIELKRLVLLGENLYFEELSSNKTDLSFVYFFQELNHKISISQNSKTTYTLKTLGLINGRYDYNNAACLLADRNDFPGTDIIKFGKDINEIEFRKTIANMSVLAQLKQAEDIFSQIYKREVISGMRREERFLIPLEVFRETVANALVHRNWDVSLHIRIAMHDDKIELYSPGGLPTGITKEEYVSGYISVLRNPILANLFSRLGLIEQFCTAIMRIKRAYHNIRHKPIFEVSENSVVTILPVGNMREDVSDDEQKVLDSLSGRFVLSSSEISDHTGFGKDKVLNLLHNLIEKRYIEKIGFGRGTRYKNI